MAKNRVLLTGAGFSRNWGGWLADEITSQLLNAINNAPHRIISDEYYRQLATDAGNYETILQEFQKLHSADPTNKKKLECVNYIEEAIQTCFLEMDSLFEGKAAGINNDAGYNAEVFLAYFDNIFTTNQDLLIERNFHNLFCFSAFSRTNNPKRNGTVLPGIRFNRDKFQYGFNIQNYRDLIIEVNDEPVDVAKESKGFLPYIKLHGSYNWKTINGNRLMISGGDKDQQIKNKSLLLKSYFAYFCESIKRPDSLIVSIGYGFKDAHINNALLEAFNNCEAKLYIIDPLAKKILRSGLIGSLECKLYGFSERPLQDILLNINEARLLFNKLFIADN